MIRAQAFMWAYNEVDIIAWAIRSARLGGVDVHVMDNWSDDGTLELVQGLAVDDPGVTWERWPERRPEKVSWYDMLQCTERRAFEARTRGYTWVMHWDADEIRCSWRPGERLVDAIERIAGRRFSVIDHQVMTYAHRPVYDGSDPETYFTELWREDRSTQRKCWRQPELRVNLASSGGHQVRFRGARVAPVTLLLKHYPFRSDAQRRRKLASRASRFAPRDRAMGFHVQYDGLLTR